MNDDISRLLQQNLPAEPPDPAGFGPGARRIRRRRQVALGLTVVALAALPVGWGVTQLNARPQIYATPTPTLSEPVSPDVSPAPTPTPSQPVTPDVSPTPIDSPVPLPSTPLPTSPAPPTPISTPTQPSSSPSRTPSAPPTSTKPGGQPKTFANFGKAAFEYFTVELKPITQEGAGRYPNFQVEVCVLKPADPNPDGTTRVSPNPWRLLLSDGVELSASPSSDFTPAFPAQSRLMPGQCAAGWLEFRSTNLSAASQKLIYSNSIGERAEWSFS